MVPAFRTTNETRPGRAVICPGTSFHSLSVTETTLPDVAVSAGRAVTASSPADETAAASASAARARPLGLVTRTTTPRGRPDATVDA